jgi:PAS domain S-box-containing protein
MPPDQSAAEIDAEVTRALAQRVLGAAPTAELALVVLAAVVVAFLVGSVPLAYAVAWAGAVWAVAAGRARWRRGASRTGLPARLVQRGMRVWVAVSGSLWGLGAAWLTLHAPFDLIALTLVVLAGLIAGAMVTLLADLQAFRMLLVSMIGIPALGLVAGGLDRDRGAAVILMLVFGAFEAAVHRRAHLTLLEHERTKAQVVRAEEAVRESEAKYRSLVEHAVLGIYRSTVDGRLVAVNAALATMLGYPSADQMLGVRAEAFYRDPAERLRLIARFRDADHITGVEVVWKRKDGTLVPVRLSGRPIRGGDDSIEAFEMMAEDLTERRGLEEQLRQSQKMDAIGQLAGGVAHDFNNLLTTVLAANELLAADLPSGAHREDTDMIRQAARRGADLTSKLLSFSRQQPLVLRSLSPGALLQEFLRLARRMVPENVVISVRMEAPEVVIRADPVAVEQVLMNLTTNARDAMPAGGALTLTLERVALDDAQVRSLGGERPGEYAVLEVRDSGVGMDAETRRRVFEPFYTTKPLDQHAGLGMAVVYGLVRQHQGFVRLESEPGRGTVVRVHFPVVDGGMAPPRTEADVGELRGGSEVVLLVEDDAALRRATSRVLERFGYAVVTASDGKEALDYLRSAPAPPDLVLSDVVMPRASGPQLLAQMREAGWRSRVLLTSGYAPRDLGEHATLDPRLPFLPKPWTVTDLLGKIREVLDAPQAAKGAGAA